MRFNRFIDKNIVTIFDFVILPLVVIGLITVLVAVGYVIGLLL